MASGLRKLLKLKDWLTVGEAARHLSILSGVDISEADVLRFALDERLTLSVYFVNKTTARCAKTVPRLASEPPTKNKDIVITINPDGFRLDDFKFIPYDADINYIGGLWDLVMIEGVRIEIEKKYQLLTGGPIVKEPLCEFQLVNRPDGTWGLILERRCKSSERPRLPYNHSDNYLPAEALPSDAVLVVRTSALRDLEALLSEPELASERPVRERERTTFLVIIAALAELARIKVERPSAAAVAVESQAALMGIHVGVRTIEEKLKLIPEALRNKADT
jgi:hypothetical protein